MPASAQVYLTVAGGVSQFNDACGTGTDCDDSGTAWKIQPGYRFANGLAVEGVIHSFGRGREAGLVGPDFVDVEVRASGFGLGVAYHTAASRALEVTVRAGLARNKTRAVDDFGPGLSQARREESTTRPYIGASLMWSLNPRLSLGAHLDHTRFSLESGYGATALTAAARFDF